MLIFDDSIDEAARKGFKLFEMNNQSNFERYMTSSSVNSDVIDAMAYKACEMAHDQFFNAVLAHNPGINAMFSQLLRLTFTKGSENIRITLLNSIENTVPDICETVKVLITYNTSQELIKLTNLFIDKVDKPTSYLREVIDELAEDYLNDSLSDVLENFHNKIDSISTWLYGVLNRAVEMENIDAIEILIKYGAIPNNYEALSRAIEYENIAIIKKLHECGTDFNLFKPLPVIEACEACEGDAATKTFEGFLFIFQNTNISPDIFKELSSIAAYSQLPEVLELLKAYELTQALASVTENAHAELVSKSTNQSINKSLNTL
ncbi:MAG: hypothetical protein HAW67_03885 [Endozoicomonadaceae bacterium]|nr:hypothetical protein [Endozoicomonadaceae bacterium]